jgi:hypothetical protein
VNIIAARHTTGNNILVNFSYIKFNGIRSLVLELCTNWRSNSTGRSAGMQTHLIKIIDLDIGGMYRHILPLFIFDEARLKQ